MPNAANRVTYVGFDIETLTPWEDGQTWRDIMPIGITCLGVVDDRDQGGPKCSRAEDGSTLDRMTRADLRECVRKLAVINDDPRWLLVTWNGMGFDWPIIAEESGMREECARLALESVDLMFQVVCFRGHRLGLWAAAEGMGVQGKPDGMNGMVGQEMWRRNEPGGRDKVLAYVRQDAKINADLARKIWDEGHLTFMTRKRFLMRMRVPEGRALTARECLELPEPGNSFEDRSDYVQWALDIAG